MESRNGSKEPERTAISRDELDVLTFFTRRRLHEGTTEAALAECGDPYWAGRSVAVLNQFAADGTFRRCQLQLESSEGAAPETRTPPPTAEWAAVGSWSIVPAPVGMPDNAIYIRVHGQSRMIVVYQVRRLPNWAWQLVSPDFVKESCPFPPRQDVAAADPELLTLDEHDLMLDAEDNGV